MAGQAAAGRLPVGPCGVPPGLQRLPPAGLPVFPRIRVSPFPSLGRGTAGPDNPGHSAPGFLLLVSSNINAGMTPFNSFQVAARPEFGPLAEEIKYAVSKSLGTTSFN